MTISSNSAGGPDSPAPNVSPPPAPPPKEDTAQLQLPHGLPVATALRKSLRQGYGRKHLLADVLAGAVVGIVALPLSMALAIAVGAPPQHGLYTAIVAGFVCALAGGSAHQVSGPTAACVVILAPIVAKYGVSGLLTAGFLAGVMLVFLGWARLGGLMRYVPAPVTTGFTTGIATVIATLQIKDFLGLHLAKMPEHFHEKIAALWAVRGTARWQEAAIAGLTLALLLGIPKVVRKIPAPLPAIVGAAAVAAGWHFVDPSFEIATIGSRFQTTINGVQYHGIPPVLPQPAWPWGSEGLTFSLVRDLLPSALAIALLGAIESLLSAVIADGMTGSQHDPDAELVGQGFGNILAPLFGGIAATGALARTATNIRAGAKSPLAAAFHALLVLAAILALAPVVSYLPMASLAALLLVVAWNMSEVEHFAATVRIAPKSDTSVLVICFLLTVIFDMVIAVSVGFVLAAVLFMRRMATLTDAKWLTRPEQAHKLVDVPVGVSLYQINGPLFFGAAHRAMAALHATSTDGFKVLILDLSQVPVIDATGYEALESTISRLGKLNRGVVLAGPLPKPAKIWERARITQRYPHVFVADDLEDAVSRSKEYLAIRMSTGRFAALRPGPQ